MSVAGAPTPLLALHWYRMMLSGVPGLVTFTTVSKDVLESTSELPNLVQCIDGKGSPLTLQVSFIFSLSLTVLFCGVTIATGAAKEKISEYKKSVMVEKIHCINK